MTGTRSPRREDDAAVRYVCVVAKSPNLADGVADHAKRAVDELTKVGSQASILVVDWRRGGVFVAANRLRRGLRHADAAVIHVSHLAWSRRGWPIGLLAVSCVARLTTQVVLWVHDPGPTGGLRARHKFVDRAKGIGLHAAARLSRTTVVSLDASILAWVTPDIRDRVRFCASPSNLPRIARDPPTDVFTVAAFGIGIGSQSHEAQALRRIAELLVSEIGHFRFRLLGAWRGADKPAVAHELEQMGVECDCPGRMSADALAERMARSNVFVHVRGGVSTRSSSLAAALGCGLPVVGVRGAETAPPVDGGAVWLVDEGDIDELSHALVALARDVPLQQQMSKKSSDLSRRHFDWSAVVDALSLDRP